MKQLPFIVFIIQLVATTGLVYGVYAPENVASPDTQWDFTYDSAGNRLSGQGSSVKFDLCGKPNVITNADNSTETFKYATGCRRYLRVHKEGSKTSKTFYLAGGAVEYRIDDSGAATSTVYIRNGNYSPVAQVGISAANSPSYTYYLRDSLKSPLAIVDDEGNVQQRSRYDAWGVSVGSSGPGVAQDDEHRGFTGHESIASANLIHMNARLQDPRLGQFISPDPIIMGMGTPSLNRYAYTHNNPLKYADITGLFPVDVELGGIGAARSGARSGARSHLPEPAANPGTIGRVRTSDPNLRPRHGTRAESEGMTPHLTELEPFFLQRLEGGAVRRARHISLGAASVHGGAYLALYQAGYLPKELNEIMARLFLSSVEQTRKLFGFNNFKENGFWAFATYFGPNLGVEFAQSSNVGRNVAIATLKTVFEFSGSELSRQDRKYAALLTSDLGKLAVDLGFAYGMGGTDEFLHTLMTSGIYRGGKIMASAIDTEGKIGIDLELFSNSVGAMMSTTVQALTNIAP